MSNERKKAAFRSWKTVCFYGVLKPNRYSKATFEVIGVRFIPLVVEAAGVEPASESALTGLSPGAVKI